MRNSYDLFHLYGWRHLLHDWEWRYMWDDTFACRIRRYRKRPEQQPAKEGGAK